VVSLLYLKQKKAVRSKIIPILPILLFWGPIWNYAYFDELLARYTGRTQPAISSWVMQWQSLFEMIFLGLLVLFFSRSLFRRYQQLQKQLAQQALEKEIERNQLIARQKVELEKTVDERTAELKQSLQELRSTQAQLIQSEKMASLGELTAGIAHEIQNPLNFVNNFSDVNAELVDEAGQEIDKGNINEVKIILNDIKENEQKINLHGKRADSIVKGMLQHSRASSGQKELTDINKLADEYLRLSYHGMRAKDKSFNAEYKTDFDNTIGKINVVPQDIGRVLLNLFNNAFYAVNEKRKTTHEYYQPTVSVVTKRINSPLEPAPKSLRLAGGIEIKVSDNGNGIPQNMVDKIFQPFFTTKPTGQGTGLGLSLAYDIIKAHGGEIKVETKEGEGSEFIILLPI
jgi:signal transduction histidine kinase